MYDSTERINKIYKVTSDVYINCEGGNIQTKNTNTNKTVVKSSKFHRVRCYPVCKNDKSTTSGKTNNYTWTGTYTIFMNKFRTNNLQLTH